MSTISFGFLEKLRIESYKDAELTEKTGEPFYALINPESYTIRDSIEYSDIQAPGRSKPVLKFNKIPAQEMSFSFLFDSTGVVTDSPPGVSVSIGLPGRKSVTEDIEKFKKGVYEYEGDIHRPFYLKIFWGTLIFKCVMTSIDIEYNLFHPDGSPIRAIARCTFRGTIDEPLLRRIENRSSPDLTHERIVKKSDRLDLMTHKIYTDQKYLVQVADFNQLDGFRKINSGTKILFPPLEK
jgi:hypothetical protein